MRQIVLLRGGGDESEGAPTSESSGEGSGAEASGESGTKERTIAPDGSTGEARKKSLEEAISESANKIVDLRERKLTVGGDERAALEQELKDEETHREELRQELYGDKLPAGAEDSPKAPDKLKDPDAIRERLAEIDKRLDFFEMVLATLKDLLKDGAEEEIKKMIDELKKEKAELEASLEEVEKDPKVKLEPRPFAPDARGSQEFSPEYQGFLGDSGSKFAESIFKRERRVFTPGGEQGLSKKGIEEERAKYHEIMGNAKTAYVVENTPKIFEKLKAQLRESVVDKAGVIGFFIGALDEESFLEKFGSVDFDEIPEEKIDAARNEVMEGAYDGPLEEMAEAIASKEARDLEEKRKLALMESIKSMHKEKYENYSKLTKWAIGKWEKWTEEQKGKKGIKKIFTRGTFKKVASVLVGGVGFGVLGAAFAPAVPAFAVASTAGLTAAFGATRLNRGLAASAGKELNIDVSGGDSTGALPSYEELEVSGTAGERTGILKDRGNVLSDLEEKVNIDKLSDEELQSRLTTLVVLQKYIKDALAELPDTTEPGTREDLEKDLQRTDKLLTKFNTDDILSRRQAIADARTSGNRSRTAKFYTVAAAGATIGSLGYNYFNQPPPPEPPTDAPPFDGPPFDGPPPPTLDPGVTIRSGEEGLTYVIEDVILNNGGKVPNDFQLYKAAQEISSSVGEGNLFKGVGDVVGSSGNTYFNTPDMWGLNLGGKQELTKGFMKALVARGWL